MNCGQARLRLGAEPDALDAALSDHLAQCPECRAFRGEMQRLERDVRRVLMPIPASFGAPAWSPPRWLPRPGVPLWALAASLAETARGEPAEAGGEHEQHGRQLVELKALVRARSTEQHLAHVQLDAQQGGDERGQDDDCQVPSCSCRPCRVGPHGGARRGVHAHSYSEFRTGRPLPWPPAAVGIGKNSLGVPPRCVKPCCDGAVPRPRDTGCQLTGS